MRTSRKQTNKKQKFQSRVQRVPPVPSGPPQYMNMRMRYVEDYSVSSVSGVPGFHQWRINDAYDINYSGGGHQSYLRDQMYTIYKSCRCLSASIKITFISASTTANVPVLVCIGPTHSTTPPTDVDTLAEIVGSKSAYLNSNTTKTLVYSTSVDDYFGYAKNTILHDTAYAQGASGTLATANSVFVCHAMKTLDASSATVYLKVEVVQIVRWEDVLMNSSS